MRHCDATHQRLHEHAPQDRPSIFLFRELECNPRPLQEQRATHRAKNVCKSIASRSNTLSIVALRMNPEAKSSAHSFHTPDIAALRSRTKAVWRSAIL